MDALEEQVRVIVRGSMNDAQVLRHTPSPVHLLPSPWPICAMPTLTFGRNWLYQRRGSSTGAPRTCALTLDICRPLKNQQKSTS